MVIRPPQAREDDEEVEDERGALAPKRRGAPIGNTNAVKHGRRSRTRGRALQLLAMVQRAQPEWLCDPSQMPEELAALFISLVERDKAVEEAATRQKNPLTALNQGVLERLRQVQASFEETASTASENAENKQPATINPGQARVGSKQTGQMNQMDQRVNWVKSLPRWPREHKLPLE
jgi:hypothetical protein